MNVAHAKNSILGPESIQTETPAIDHSDQTYNVLPVTSIPH